MRSRTLLPAAVAAATVAALVAPASADEAPPPAPDAYNEPAETYTEDDCAQALKVLSYYKLLPNQPDVGRALCSMNQSKQQEQGDHTNEINSKHTTDTGQSAEENKLLGIPVEWPKSLTVHVPTVNDHWYTYTSKKPS